MKVSQVQQITVDLLKIDGTLKTLEEIEREVIVLAYVYHRKNTSEVCRQLGIGRSTFYRRCQKYVVEI